MGFIKFLRQDIPAERRADFFTSWISKGDVPKLDGYLGTSAWYFSFVHKTFVFWFPRVTSTLRVLVFNFAFRTRNADFKTNLMFQWNFVLNPEFKSRPRQMQQLSIILRWVPHYSKKSILKLDYDFLNCINGVKSPSIYRIFFENRVFKWENLPMHCCLYLRAAFNKMWLYAKFAFQDNILQFSNLHTFWLVRFSDRTFLRVAADEVFRQN